MAVAGNTLTTLENVTGQNYGNVVADYLQMPETGWVTGFRVHAGGHDAPTHARLALWSATGARMAEGPELQWGPGAAWREFTGMATPFNRADALWLGFWRDKDQPSEFSTHDPGGSAGVPRTRVQTHTADRNVPPLGTFDRVVGQLAAEITYVPNQKPLPPTFLAPTPVAGEVANLTLTVACELPHHPDEMGMDRTTRVQVVLVRTASGIVDHDSWYEVTEYDPLEFEATLPNLLVPGQAYRLFVRHQDTFGANSDFIWVDFTSSLGPDETTITVPAAPGRIAAPKPVEFRGTYSNPLGRQFYAVRVQIYGEVQTWVVNWQQVTRVIERGYPVYSTTGRRKHRKKHVEWRAYYEYYLEWVPVGGQWVTQTVMLWDSQWHGSLQAVQLVGEWVIGNEWLPAALSPGRLYTVLAYTMDSTGATGPYGSRQIFINSAPRVPFDMTPAGGALVASRVLRCSLSDPEGDPITSVEYLVLRKSDGIQVAGGTMQIAPDGKSASVDPGTAILADVAYIWFARASDGDYPSPSAWSAAQEFTYAPVPVVTPLLPQQDLPRNLTEDPSFEYNLGWWLPTQNEAASNLIQRVSDANAYSGDWSLRGTVGDATAASPVRRSDFFQVDPTRAYYFSARLMREILSAPAATHFRVEAYNGAGVLLGSLYPGNLPNGVDVGTSWTEREGFIGPAAQGYLTSFPAGTVQCKYAFEPSRNVVSIVRLDAIQHRQLSAGTTYSQAQLGKRWLGYFDGDTISRRALDPEGGDPVMDFEWEAITGDSVSRGTHVLEYPAVDVVFSYVGEGGFAKNADRTYIQRLIAGVWKQIYDSGWITGTRTSIPMPPGILTNQSFYRMRIEARDTRPTPRIARTPWIEFQTNYEGPAAPAIVEATGSPETGSSKLRWERTQLTQLEFGGYEVAMAEYGQREAEILLAHIGNADNLEFSWHAPLSGRDYYLMVRQIQKVGADEISGDWSRALVRVDYRKWFIKSMKDPAGDQVAFDLMAEDVVTADYPAGSTEVELWGVDQPTYYTDERDQATMTVVVRLDRRDPNLSSKDKALQAIRRQRRFGCLLLTTDPERAYYMHIDSVSEEYSDWPWYSTWTFGLKQMAYEQDYNLREGMVPVG